VPLGVRLYRRAADRGPGDNQRVAALARGHSARIRQAVGIQVPAEALLQPRRLLAEPPLPTRTRRVVHNVGWPRHSFDHTLRCDVEARLRSACRDRVLNRCAPIVSLEIVMFHHA
jgi:hypothetical protein